MAFTIKNIEKSSDVAKFIASSILTQLKLKKVTLFFISGGSSIDVAVEVSRIIKEYPHENLTVMLSDERYGPINHPDSNYFKIMDKGFSLPQAKIIPILTGDTYDTTTQRFNAILNQELKRAEYKIGLFGVGKDGHTAGILPDSPACYSKELALAYDTPSFFRITITERTIEKLDEAIVFAQGEEKMEVIKNLEKDIDVVRQPAQILKKVLLLTVFFINN